MPLSFGGGLILPWVGKLTKEGEWKKLDPQAALDPLGARELLVT
mgnify:CR=1 FL=1